MEQVVFGSTRKSAPLADRIRNLEIHAMCQTQTGTLKGRVDKLVQVIGLSNTETGTESKAERKTATSAPPFAPPIGITRPRNADPVANHSSVHHIGATATKASVSKVDEVRQVLLHGIKLHQEGKLSEAEVKFKQVLTLDPYNADACFSLGSLAEGNGDLAGALGFYSTAAVANPNDREAREAVLQVQELIAQQQGPFVNPLSVAQKGATPLLQARASEFTAADIQQQGLLHPQAPAYATLGPPTFPSGSIRQSSQAVPTLNVGQNPPPRPSTGKTVARGLARVAVGAALNYSGLHCPLCNILRGF
ncbi:MAG: tetratricopeptide repeat protein [Candidatus Obscuribacterales bacterium]|nr:tetratricopeptide repeat protein [Candidatus Obscuribacterales bacterium]